MVLGAGAGLEGSAARPCWRWPGHEILPEHQALQRGESLAVKPLAGGGIGDTSEHGELLGIKRLVKLLLLADLRQLDVG
jgi:hypothetical protein